MDKDETELLRMIIRRLDDLEETLYHKKRIQHQFPENDPPSWELTFRGDYYTEHHLLKEIIDRKKVLIYLSDLDERIRERLSYEELPESEDRFLREILVEVNEYIGD